MARAATAPELALLRTAGQWSKWRVAIYAPATVYTARVNQTFSTFDKILQVTYDGGSGTLANVKIGMTLLVGSSAGAHDKGILRIRKTPTSSIFYVGEHSDIAWADNLYLTVIADFDLWARHIALSGSTPLMDGDVTYSDQHTNFDPVPVMGSHRVEKLEGADVTTIWDGSESWVYGSSISGYSWSAPTASSTSSMTTATPTIEFDDVDWHLVYLTVTAANGKSFTGVRLVYVWDDDNPPPGAEISDDPSVDFNSGGWSFGVTMYANADTIRDRALVILFAEDHYGDTAQSIGPLEGCENIVCVGRVAGESIQWNPEQGKVTFTVQGAQHWFGQMKGFPSGLRMVTGAPAAWTEMQSLTVGRALWHFLHWRTTATKIMDIYLTEDDRLLSEVSSLGGKLWGQMSEFAFNTILANIGIDRYGRLFAEIDPQMLPSASRSAIPTVMTITKQDWQGTPDIERVIVDEVGVIDLSGVEVNTSVQGKSFFSLAPGHVMKHYGDDYVVDHIAAYDTQSENNQLAGLMLGWKDNEFPRIDMELSANNRLFDCFPRQYAQITIDADDTPRGIAYSGKLIPRYVSFRQREDGYKYTEIAFEAETFEKNSTNGDIPFSPSDVSIPPVPPFPPLPEFPILLPGFPQGNPGEGPKRVMLHDVNMGLIYSENFNASGASVKWRTVNSGLENVVLDDGVTKQYQLIHRFYVTPSGVLYAGRFTRIPGNVWGGHADYFMVARAPYIGGTFEIIQDRDTLEAEGAPGFFDAWGITALNINPLVSEQAAFVVRKDQPSTVEKIYIGAGTSFSAGAALDPVGGGGAPAVGLSYGLSRWLYLRYGGWQAISADGATVVGSGTDGNLTLLNNSEAESIVRASTTGKTFLPGDGLGSPTKDMYVGENNMASGVWISDSDISMLGMACDPSGQLLMSRYGVGAKGRSSDGGATWSPLPSLPPGVWYFAYAGNAGSESRWVAAGGSAIRYSPDFGDTWLNKEGNIQQIAPIPSIDGVKVVEY